nr:MFS transporter [Corynebacterium sp. 13CS0277]
MCAAAGASAGPVVVAFVCVSLDGESGQLLARALGAQVVGQLVSTFVSGAVVDRSARRTLMQVCYVAQAVVFATYAALLWAGQLPRPAIVALAGCGGVISGLVGPALQSVVPQLVPAEELVRANGRLRTTVSVASVVAPAVAGGLLHRVGMSLSAAVVAAVFVAASVVVSFLPPLPRPEARHFLRELVAGWVLFARTRWFAVVSVSCAVINVLWAAVYATWGPVRAVAVGWGAAGWGVIGSCFAAGLIVGASIFGRVSFRHPVSAAVLGQVGKAAPMVALFLSDELWVVAAAAVVAGIGLECFVIHFTSTAQAVIPHADQGKVFAVDAFVGLSLMPVGYWMAGAVERTVGPAGMGAAAVVAAAVVVAVAGAVGWWLRRQPAAAHT